MSEHENLVTEQVAENVEQTTEQTPKTYTQEEFEAAVNSKVDDVLGKKIARKEAKIRKEYDRKYGQLEEVLKAGTGKESVEEITDSFASFYRGKGIQIPEKPKYEQRDIEVLANADVAEIIRGGFEEVVEEADRLNAIGFENMTAREKAAFVALTNHIKETETSRELAKIGVTEDVYNSQEFRDFAGKFNPNTPITDVYNIYRQTLPKKEHKPMGSMKNTTVDSGVKDFYSYEEAVKFTKEDFDKNPALYAAVQKSMQKWR